MPVTTATVQCALLPARRDARVQTGLSCPATQLHGRPRSLPLQQAVLRVLVEHHLIEHAVGEVLAVRDRLDLALRLEPVHLRLLECRLRLNVSEHLLERSQPVQFCPIIRTSSRRLTPGQRGGCQQCIAYFPTTANCEILVDDSAKERHPKRDLPSTCTITIPVPTSWGNAAEKCTRLFWCALFVARDFVS